jgi:hypothetical protein
MKREANGIKDKMREYQEALFKKEQAVYKLNQEVVIFKQEAVSWESAYKIERKKNLNLLE